MPIINIISEVENTIEIQIDNKIYRYFIDKAILHNILKKYYPNKKGRMLNEIKKSAYKYDKLF